MPLDLTPSTAVLVVHSSGVFGDDVRDKLVATGSFSDVDLFDAEGATPTADDLAPYAAVLVYSDHSFDDPTALGDLLADYVDGGGGVVQAAFASGLVALGGRFDEGGYEALTGSNQDGGRAMSLVVVDPEHPLLQDVGSFAGGSASYHTPDAALADGAVEVATWSNGVPLVAARERVVDLNFFPPSSDARGDLWTADTDGDLLLRNALLYAAGAFEEPPDDDTGCGGGHGDDDDDDDDDDDGHHHHGHHGVVTITFACATGGAGVGWLPATIGVALLRRRRCNISRTGA
jgi:hypothetical protein